MRSEAGFTLTEVLVTALVGTVVLLAAFSLLDAAAPLTAKTHDTVDATQRGRGALDQMTAQLRSLSCLDVAGPPAGTVPPVVSGTSDEVIFYANTGDENALPDKRRLAFTGNSIVEQTWKGSGASPNTTFPTSSTRTLVANATRVTSTTPVFSYWGFTGSAPAAPTVALTAPLASTDLDAVVKIDVKFIVRPDRAVGASKRELIFQGSSFVRSADPNDPAQGPQCQ